MNLDGLRPWGGLVGGGDAAAVVVAGIPYDGSAVYRKGAALAPQRIRQLSAAMPPVTEEGRLLAGLRVKDIGDLEVGQNNIGQDIETGWMKPMERLAALPAESFLTVLGGDHCTAISTLAAQLRRHPGMHVLWVDAHPDLCDFSRGGHWTCGCALRRALEASGIEPERVVIAGGRDYDPEELEFIAANGILLVSAAEIARDLTRAAGKIADRLAGHDVHVSFDIDVLDPAFAPGTEIPSSGGLSTRQALDLLHGSTAFTPGRSRRGRGLAAVRQRRHHDLCRPQADLRGLGNGEGREGGGGLGASAWRAQGALRSSRKALT